MAKKKEPMPVPGPGRFAYEGLDRIMHEKARLGIMTSLIGRSGAETMRSRPAASGRSTAAWTGVGCS